MSVVAPTGPMDVGIPVGLVGFDAPTSLVDISGPHELLWAGGTRALNPSSIHVSDPGLPPRLVNGYC